MNLPEQFDLNQEYELLWEQGQKSLRTNGTTTDNLLLPVSHDKRQGLGLFFWQDSLVPAIQPFLEELHKAFHEQIVLYGFPNSPGVQHVTLLEMVATQPDYEANFAKYESGFKAVYDLVLQNAAPIKAKFRGFAANSGSILMKGFPEDDSFNSLREQLRNEIVKAGLPPLQRRKVQIFHTTVGRFIQPIGDVERLIGIIGKFKDFEVGEDTFQELHLVRASWLMNSSQIQELAKFELK